MPAPDRSELARVAVTIAEEAGGLLRERLGGRRTEIGTKSSMTDMVSEVDRASEALIARRLRDLRPNDGLLAEEGTAAESRSGVDWIVDPLDGTTNYLYGFPAFAVSVAARLAGEIVAGAVHDPVHGETFTAVRGGGATCNGRALRAPDPPPLATALVGTGFSYNPERRRIQAAMLPRILGSVRDIRRAGAAALDLCWLAAGRLDAFYEWGLAPWDWAAGALVAEEAGHGLRWLADSTLVVAEPRLLDPLVDLIDAASAP